MYAKSHHRVGSWPLTVMVPTHCVHCGPTVPSYLPYDWNGGRSFWMGSTDNHSLENTHERDLDPSRTSLSLICFVPPWNLLPGRTSTAHSASLIYETAQCINEGRPVQGIGSLQLNTSWPHTGEQYSIALDITPPLFNDERSKEINGTIWKRESWLKPVVRKKSHLLQLHGSV